jgi:2-hydroxychromene-2-carboxylate isomerase
LETTPSIDFYFFIGSTYTYLSVLRAEDAARDAGVMLKWRPFFLRDILAEMDNSPFVGKPAKRSYMWRDLEHRAALHGLRFEGAPPYPVDPQGVANRVAHVAATHGWCAEYVRAVYRGGFLEKNPPGDPGFMRTVPETLGRDPASVLEAADSDGVRSGLARRTDEARRLGVFGSPSFVCGSEVFWGDDRLEEALAWATGRHPARS